MKSAEIVAFRDGLLRKAGGQSPTLLIVGPVEEAAGGESVFHQFSWQTERARSCCEVLLHVQLGLPRVIVCERDLPDGSWKDVLEMAALLDTPPPVIVTSRLADDYLWAEVLNLGGYDVLTKPLDLREVGRTVGLAWARAEQAGVACADREGRRQGRILCLTA